MLEIQGQQCGRRGYMFGYVGAGLKSHLIVNCSSSDFGILQALECAGGKGSELIAKGGVINWLRHDG